MFVLCIASKSVCGSSFVVIIYDDARIDPGSAFRLVVKVSPYVADGEYGLVEMAEQQHNIWFDRNSQYWLNSVRIWPQRLYGGLVKHWQFGFLTKILGLSGS